MAQLIWTGNEYEIATTDNSEIPSWPVQDEGGRWHRKEFVGQRVSYHQQTVWFGFKAKKLTAAQVSKLNLDNLPEDVYTVGFSKRLIDIGAIDQIGFYRA